MHQADPARYAHPSFQARCGKSGLHLPKVSLGLWHNFGSVDDFANARAIALRAFDLGVTHFDLANNYGPVPGSAEETFGRILREDLGAYRDELILSTKAGYTMWPGPHGDFGSRKYLLASLDQSLKRMGLPYVDIFYSHRRDPNTPLEETMGALAQAVRSGKALYAAISNYNPADTARACATSARRASSTSPSTACSNAPRRPACSTRSKRRASVARSSRRSPKGCSPTVTSKASRRMPGPGSRTGSSRPNKWTPGAWRRSACSAGSPKSAASPWPRWPWRGCSATSA
jgi:aryl-alcohol dehydrogenase-like predicted oxidoreductase